MTTLDAKLAAELEALVVAVGDAYNAAGTPADPAHRRAILRAEAVVPVLREAARETAVDLGRLTTDPPANPRTRARLTEQLAFRASTFTWLLQQVAVGLDTHTPPADVADAQDGLCSEIVRLTVHAQAFAVTDYGDDTDAAEAAGMIGAQLRGEIDGVRRSLAILLGLPTHEIADSGEVDAYVAAWQAARTPVGTAPALDDEAAT